MNTLTDQHEFSLWNGHPFQTLPPEQCQHVAEENLRRYCEKHHYPKSFFEQARVMVHILAASCQGIPIATKHVVAVHEAGHVVLSTLIGRHIKDVSITARAISADVSEWGGWTGWDRRAPRGLEDALLGIGETMAGFIAEELFCPDWPAHWSSFDERATAMLSCMTIAPLALPEIDGAVRRALTANEAAVRAVAKALELRHRLSGSEVHDILAAHDCVNQETRWRAFAARLLRLDDSGLVSDLLAEFAPSVDPSHVLSARRAERVRLEAKIRSRANPQVATDIRLRRAAGRARAR